MEIIEIIFIATTLLFTSAFIIYLFKYRKLKKQVKEYEDIGTGRCGFYLNQNNSLLYRTIVYVKEIDRYTDGYSKIKIDRIEVYDRKYSRESKQRVHSDFMSLKDTDKIEWLESEKTTKQARKEKLKNINNL